MRSKLVITPAMVPLFAALSACAAGEGKFPSLAMRPFESGAVVEAPAPPAPVRPATPPARIAELRSTAAAADAAFTTRESEAVRLARAAAGLPFESKARAAAIVALADLDAQRGKTAGVLATLDMLAAEASGALSPDPAVTAAQSDIAAMVAREDAAIVQLWRVMGP